jgi:C-terminal processing protease CtpA/Prc
VYAWHSAGDTAVIEIRRLWGSPEESELLKQIADDYPKHRQHRRLVFDFRGNGGGDDAHMYRWIERAHRGPRSIRPSVEIFGALAPCSYWNYRVAHQIGFDIVDTPDAERERSRIREAWPNRVPAVHHRVFDGHMRSDAKRPYRGDVIVLVDRRSASSGESGPEALARALGARLVGERTGGFLEYGNMRTFVLPHTGIVMHVPTKRNYHDPPAEGVGLPVDVYLPPELLARPANELLDLLGALR